MGSTNLKILRIFGALFVLLLSGCTGSPEVAFTPLPVNTPLATLTPTLPPPGSPENPLILGLVSTNQPDTAGLQQEAQDLMDGLRQRASLNLDFRFYPSYEDLIQALENRQIHWGFLPPLTYIHAHQRNLADVELLSNHFGVYFYSSAFLSNVESGMVAYYDPATGQSTAPAKTALAQFAGKRPCWIEPTSIAGYLLPKALLQSLEVETLPAVIAQTPSAVVRALYIKGICDFGATFGLLGDPRTASSVIEDLPDAQQRVIIIWQSDPIIPTLNVAFHPDVPLDVRRRVSQDLQDMAREKEISTAISRLNGGYDIQGFKIVDDSVYDPLREAITVLDLDLNSFLGK